MRFALTNPRMRELGKWYSRGYLPHFDEGGTEQVITYRLADALPEEVLLKIGEQTSLGAPAARRHAWEKAGQRPALPVEAIERHLDAGHGCCALRNEKCAQAVIENWRCFDKERYRLLAWVVMPNHVHVLVRIGAGESLARVLQSWKSYTAKRLLQLMPGGLFPQRRVWQRDYWDRFIRDEAHRSATIRYIHENPVKAGLVKRAEDWRWSSAFTGNADTGSTGGPQTGIGET